MMKICRDHRHVNTGLQSGGLAIGQRDSLGSASASLVLPRAKLPHRQSSARGANLARSAFRST
jgi:hypothetical protein